MLCLFLRPISSNTTESCSIERRLSSQCNMLEAQQTQRSDRHNLPLRNLQSKLLPLRKTRRRLQRNQQRKLHERIRVVPKILLAMEFQAMSLMHLKRAMGMRRRPASVNGVSRDCSGFHSIGLALLPTVVRPRAQQLARQLQQCRDTKSGGIVSGFIRQSIGNRNVLKAIHNTLVSDLMQRRGALALT